MLNITISATAAAAATLKVLAADLLLIMREAEALGVKAEAVDDDVHHWRVLYDLDALCTLSHLLAEDLDVTLPSPSIPPPLRCTNCMKPFYYCYARS